MLRKRKRKAAARQESDVKKKLRKTVDGQYDEAVDDSTIDLATYTTEGACNDSSDEDDVVSDEECDEPIPCTIDDKVLIHLKEDKPAQGKSAKKSGQINFEGEAYRSHVAFMPQDFKATLESMAELFEVKESEKQLLASYMAFVFLLFKEKNHMATDQVAIYEDWENTLSDADRKIFETMKSAARHLPDLDSFTRSRGKQAMTIYRKVSHADYPEKSLGVWLLFDFIFRYFGQYAPIEHLFWMDAYDEKEFKSWLQGLYSGSMSSEEFADLLCNRVLRVVRCHSTISAFFEKGDGRRRTFPKDDPRLGRYGLCSRYVDHLLSAIPLWLQECLQLGEDLQVVLESIHSSDDASCSKALEEFMLALSKATLLGKMIPTAKPFAEHLCSYALKFVSGDIYFLLASLSCCGEATARGSIRHDCSCKSCECVRRLRGNYIFMGPSPLILHATMSRTKVDGTRTLHALREFRALLCTTFGCYVDLYCAQMLPCMWRHWLRSIRLETPQKTATVYRQLAESTLLYECDRIKSSREWVAHFGLMPLLKKVDIGLAADFLLKYKFRPAMAKKPVEEHLKRLCQ